MLMAGMTVQFRHNSHHTVTPDLVNTCPLCGAERDAFWEHPWRPLLAGQEQHVIVSLVDPTRHQSTRPITEPKESTTLPYR